MCPMSIKAMYLWRLESSLDGGGTSMFTFRMFESQEADSGGELLFYFANLTVIVIQLNPSWSTFIMQFLMVLL